MDITDEQQSDTDKPSSNTSSSHVKDTVHNTKAQFRGMSDAQTGDNDRVRQQWNQRTHGVVGLFPNPAVLLRLAVVFVLENPDEWEDGDRHYLSEASIAELKTMNTGDTESGEGGQQFCFPNYLQHNQKTIDPHGFEIVGHAAGHNPFIRRRRGRDRAPDIGEECPGFVKSCLGSFGSLC